MKYEIGKAESERLNVLKLWLSVLIVYLHSYPGGGGSVGGEGLWFQGGGALRAAMFIISHVIGDCAVPGFFLLSGLFLFRKDFGWTDNLRKKLRSLLVPYLLLNTFWICFYFVFQHAPGLSVYFTNGARNISQWSLQNWINAYIGRNVNEPGATMPFLSPLWFVRDLMVLNLIAPALRRLMERLPRICLIALLAMQLLDVDFHLFFLQRRSLFYFCLGWYVARANLHIAHVDRIPSWIIPAACPASMALYILLRDWKLIGPLVSLLTRALSILFIARFLTRSRNPARNEKLKYLAGFSTSIYFFHQMNLMILRKFAARLLPATALSELLIYLVAPPAIIGFCVAVSILLKRYQPRVYAALTGGR